jgi:hypothetical protein
VPSSELQINLTYIFTVPSQLPSANLPYTDFLYSVYQISCPFSLALVIYSNNLFKSETLCNISFLFYCFGDDLLAPRQTSKLDDHPFSAVGNCLFNIDSQIEWYLFFQVRVVKHCDGEGETALSSMKSDYFAVSIKLLTSQANWDK